jgi:hypothetical protein
LFETIDDYEEAIVPLMGPHYDLDNHVVFDSLKSHLLNGPAWTWIQDFDPKRDSRSAWKALQAHYEGVGGQIQMKTAAYASIKRAEYKGQRILTLTSIRRFILRLMQISSAMVSPSPKQRK